MGTIYLSRDDLFISDKKMKSESGKAKKEELMKVLKKYIHNPEELTKCVQKLFEGTALLDLTQKAIEQEMDKKKQFVQPYTKQFKLNYTLLELLPEYLRNFDVNIETAKIDTTISDLPQIADSALIIDHPFTGSFDRQVEDLKRFKGKILCCDRCLYQALINNIVPDYVLNVDASWLCTSFFDNKLVRQYMDQITAIFAVTTFPLTIRTWTGKKVFFTPTIASCSGLEQSIAAKSKTDLCVCGGSVHNTAWSIAYALGAKTIGLYGIDNAYDNPEQCEHIGIDLTSYYVKELDRTLYTDSVYKFYAEMLFNWIEYTAGTVGVVNATESGIMYNSIAKKMGYEVDIKKMCLKEFVEG